MEMKKLFEIGLEVLKKDPLYFICHNPNCNSCQWARLLYENKEIDLEIYKDNGCTDTTCEICVVE